MEKEWTLVYTCNKLYNAELLKALLLDNYIVSIIINKNDSNYRFGDIELWVSNDDYEKALEIINNPENSIE